MDERKRFASWLVAAFLLCYTTGSVMGNPECSFFLCSRDGDIDVFITLNLGKNRPDFTEYSIQWYGNESVPLKHPKAVLDIRISQGKIIYLATWSHIVYNDCVLSSDDMYAVMRQVSNSSIEGTYVVQQVPNNANLFGECVLTLPAVTSVPPCSLAGTTPQATTLGLPATAAVGSETNGFMISTIVLAILMIVGIVVVVIFVCRSALSRHQESGDHRLAKSIQVQAKQMQKEVEKVTEAATDSVTAQVRTAVTMAYLDLPDTKFLPLLSQKQNGASALNREEDWYKGHTVVKDMQAAAARFCYNKLALQLQKSPFIGVMLDESLDIAVQKKLVIYFKLLVDGEPVVQFGTNCEIQNGKSATIVTALREYLHDLGIPLDKVIGIGTDGANVMIGSVNGVTTVLKRLNPSLVSVWCCAHRLALVAHWAAQGVPSLVKVQGTLLNLYKYFKYSAVRQNNLKRLKAIMQEKVKKFKKPTAVRWLSVQDAVKAAQESWGALVLTLEHEATSNERDSALALSLLKEIKTYNFIAMLCMLRDVLEPLTKCSLSFQRDNIDVEVTSRMLYATLDLISVLPENPGVHISKLHDSLETEQQYQNIRFQTTPHQQKATLNICSHFVNLLRTEVEKRFPAEDMSTLKALNQVLNPNALPVEREKINAHGEKHLESLTEAFSQVDGKRAKGDYLQFKYLLNANRDHNLQSMCTTIIQEHAEQFPDFAVLAQIFLVVPLTSVPCERAFSVQNSVMDKKRNRMSVQTLNNKMMILADKNPEAVVQGALQEFAASKRLRLK